MALIKSLSGIRGTIGGLAGNNLTPFDIILPTIQFVKFLNSINLNKDRRIKVVVGRDARKSGLYISNILTGFLQSMGVDVIDCGLSTTPSIELTVPYFQADGGIIITASHNPINWNALKFLNSKGELLSPIQGERFLDSLQKPVKDIISETSFAEINNIGTITIDTDSINRHIQNIIDLSIVKPNIIAQSNFKVVIDPINSSGAIALTKLLEALGIKDIISINCDLSGDFSHDPEPLAKNLHELANYVKKHNANLGIAVDPDVDRLSLIDENGNFLSEEYTLVLASDYILQNKLGNLVSNISSTLALRDLSIKYKCKHEYAKVGEANVVEKMKAMNAIIGGEGNGGVIYPELHYGRDALIGVALILSYMAVSKLTISKLKSKYSQYIMIKDKINIENKNLLDIQNNIKNHYSKHKITTIDGIRVDFGDAWIHVRSSNTEPIIRIYSEAKTSSIATDLIRQVKLIIDK